MTDIIANLLFIDGLYKLITVGLQFMIVMSISYNPIALVYLVLLSPAIFEIIISFGLRKLRRWSLIGIIGLTLVSIVNLIMTSLKAQTINYSALIYCSVGVLISVYLLINRKNFNK